MPKFSSSLHDISAAEYLTLVHNYENRRAYNSQIHTNNDNNHEDLDEKMDNNTDYLMSFLTNQHPGDIRNILSSPLKHKSNGKVDPNKPQDIPKRKLNTANHVSITVTRNNGSLIDRGANGGLAGDDVRVVCNHDPSKFINVSGIDSHQVKDLPIVTAGGVAPSQRGDIIVILHQYTPLGKGNSIHSSIQLEA